MYFAIFFAFSMYLLNAIRPLLLRCNTDTSYYMLYRIIFRGLQVDHHLFLCINTSSIYNFDKLSHSLWRFGLMCSSLYEMNEWIKLKLFCDQKKIEKHKHTQHVATSDIRTGVRVRVAKQPKSSCFRINHFSGTRESVQCSEYKMRRSEAHKIK